MWSKEKAQHQREYFSQQRRNPTGNFTEFVVRTYYCIDKACRAHKSNCCFADEVNNNKIKNIITINPITILMPLSMTAKEI